MRLSLPRLSFRHRLPHYNPETPPGTLIADPEAQSPHLRVMAYGPEKVTEAELSSPDEIDLYLEKWPIVWLNVDGLGDAGVVERIGKRFGLHKLALEDVMNRHQRPKAESYDEHLFVILRMLTMTDRLHTEQIGLFVGRGWVVTFQERAGDPLDPVRRRIRQGQGRIRSMGADYLAYSLMDAVVDGVFPVLEAADGRLESLENAVMGRPGTETIADIHQVKRDLLRMRRAVWPMREAINGLLREEHPEISADTHLYLRDTYDHITQIIDIAETFREIAGGLMDAYLSNVSNRMNEVMKVLTIIATIFIPLGFIAGLYGMNFNPEASPWNMPELDWRYGYPAALGAMALVALGMLTYFYRKGWLGGGNGEKR